MENVNSAFYYINDDGLCSALLIMTKQYTLEELYAVQKETSEQFKRTKNKYVVAADEFSAYLKGHNLRVAHELPEEFNALIEKRDELSDELHLYEIALQGIRGAIRYYQAVALNDAIARVLPKYSGKQAGPKTKEKFWKEVASYLPHEPRLYCNYYYCVSLWDAVTGADNSFYSNDNLNTAGNQFTDKFEVCVPKDAFEGTYPQNWIIWAMHVDRANKNIQTKFEEFYQYMEGLHRCLTIGDTMMLSVSKCDLRER